MGKLWIAAIVAFAIDQASKVWVVHMLNLKSLVPGEDRIEVFPPYLIFQIGWNTGINFGLFSGANARLILIAIALAISAALLWWARKFTRPIAFVSAGLVIGGALANVLDRLIYGAVADFLNMSCCGYVNPYSFNIADVFIFAGAFGLVLFAEDAKAGDDAPKTR